MMEISQTLLTQWGIIPLNAEASRPHVSVLYGVRKLDQLPVVIKQVVDTDAFHQERATLEWFAHRGGVKLLASDDAHQALLLERIMPGTPLSSLFPHQDELACCHAVEVIQLLHHPPHAPVPELPSVETWLKTLDQSHPSIPSHHLEKARQLKQRLLNTQNASVVLHGDLHHDNILQDTTDNWIAIDPKGVVGEIAYEVGALIRNPISMISTVKNSKDILQKRLQIFSKHLGIEPSRLKEWAYVQSILAACWAVEDNESPETWLLIGKTLDSF